MTDRIPWYDQDEFWEKCGPIIFGKQRILDAPEQIDKIINLLSFQKGAEVLDLCCGVGRHSLEFARRGFKVTGVDRTKLFLERATKIAKEENLDVEFVQEDMRKFMRPDTYDLILNLSTSFGYFENLEEDKQVVSNMFQSLKKGGVFLVDMISKEICIRGFK